MVMDNVAQMLLPDPDSQWRLKDCSCGSDEVVYLQVNAEPALWKVRCMKCGKETEDHAIRHNAQLEWNT